MQQKKKKHNKNEYEQVIRREEKKGRHLTNENVTSNYALKFEN